MDAKHHRVELGSEPKQTNEKIGEALALREKIVRAANLELKIDRAV